MRERTDHPPSPEASTRNANATARRAVIGGVAGVALLVGPVALANAVVPTDDAAGSATVEAGNAQQKTSLVALRQKSKQISVTDSAKSDALQSLRTTTTPPPTTTTTVPPTTTTTAPPTTTTTVPPTTEAPAPPPTEAPAPPPPSSGGFGDPNNYETWDALAECEAGGDWYINTGNGYYGGLQFSLSSWQGVGGQGYPHENSREVQIQMGQRLQASSGWGAWPYCSSELGLR